MAKKKANQQPKQAADLNQKVTVKVLNSLRGKYKLPYSKGHVVSLNELVAAELVKANDAEYFDEEKAAEQIEVVDPKVV